MPMVELELVISDKSEEIRPDAIQEMADQLGNYFGGETAGTWLRIRYLDRAQYAENGVLVPDSVKPTFVSVLMYELPAQEQRADSARVLAGIVATCTGRPAVNTHIVFESAGKGRVAFGGELVR